MAMEQIYEGEAYLLEFLKKLDAAVELSRFAPQKSSPLLNYVFAKWAEFEGCVVQFNEKQAFLKNGSMQNAEKA